MNICRGLLSYCQVLAFSVIATCASLSQVPKPFADNQAVVPQSMRYSGVARNRAGDTVEAAFRIYASQEGGEPLWSETQRVTIGEDSRYSVLLGSATQGGLPQDVFADGQARWLSISIERAPEQPRVLLVSVPYAMKAADAETLGGVPAGEFVTQTQFRANVPVVETPETTPEKGRAAVHPNAAPSGSGTANTVALWTSSSSLGNSALTQSGMNVTAAGSITGQSNTAAAAVAGTNNATVGLASAVIGRAESTTTNSSGVTGIESAAMGAVYGIRGTAASTTTNAAGVIGNESASSGKVYGVYGTASSTTFDAAAVSGFESAPTGHVYGVSGIANSAASGAAGVAGFENANTGLVYGVVGATNSSTDYAAALDAEESALSGQVFGVWGIANSRSANAAGVNGYEQSTTGSNFGVNGTAFSTTAKAAGVNGFEWGLTGEVYGVSGGTYSSTDNAAGVNGYEEAASGQVYGVIGAASSSTPGAAGVRGYEYSTSGGVAGVWGGIASTSGAGVFGSASASTGGTAGVYGESYSSTGSGVVGVARGKGGTAGTFMSPTATGTVIEGRSGAGSTRIFSVDANGDGVFSGNLTVNGTTNLVGAVSKPAGSFKIDHPLDPADKYLYHSFVESPDMMNVYNGNVITNKHGMATVVLPDYFEALNRDFRYQLTVIGQFAQAIVASKIKDNRFMIRTSKPKVEVSWQVTGIRQDAYANANRIPVEVDKPVSERGYYLHPEVFGQPAEKSIANAGKHTTVENLGVQGSR